MLQILINPMRVTDLKLVDGLNPRHACLSEHIHYSITSPWHHNHLERTHNLTQAQDEYTGLWYNGIQKRKAYQRLWTVDLYKLTYHCSLPC